MLGLLMVLMLQATDPAPATEPAATEASQTAAQPAETTATAEEDAAEQRRRRRCTQRGVTGSRLSHVVTCRSQPGYQDQDTRDTLHNIQRPPPAQAG